MWTRKGLKTKAKAVVKRSYWKVVLVSLLLMVFTGALGSGSYVSNDTSNTSESYQNDVNEMSDDLNEMSTDVAELKIELEKKGMETENVTKAHNAASLAVMIAVAIGFLIVTLIIFAVGITLSALVFNPFIVGIKGFFSKEMKETTKVSTITFAFDHSYKNHVKIMFFKDLYTFLWTLLFIVPGIVKAYEYRMMPYILSENPDMSMDEVFARSKEMMYGQKWNVFVLDLSFVGWNFLSLCTCFLLSIFYVAPYKNLTDAELYNTLSAQYVNDTNNNELSMYDLQN